MRSSRLAFAQQRRAFLSTLAKGRWTTPEEATAILAAIASEEADSVDPTIDAGSGRPSPARIVESMCDDLAEAGPSAYATYRGFPNYSHSGATVVNKYLIEKPRWFVGEDTHASPAGRPSASTADWWFNSRSSLRGQ